MFIRVGPEIASYWIARCPDRAPMLENDGCLYFELNRYVYGLHEASNQFNSFLDKHLQEIGFRPAKADPCMYTMDTEDGKLVVSIHVDDMLLTSPNEKQQKWFEKTLGKHFDLVAQYDSVSYLGMMIRRDNKSGSVFVDQHGYLRTILKKHGCDRLTKFPSTPSNEDLLTETPDDEPTNKTTYLSLVMSLMYLGRFTRPDILMTVSFLASKCSKPTMSDYSKLLRVLHYLAGTESLKLVYAHGIPFEPIISADASHHLYPEGHGQLGMFIFNGSAPVACRSVKIKLMTRSSSESELCSVEDASTFAVWYKLLLSDLGIELSGPITILQDNQSTIIIAIQGASFKRTKHLIGRQSYVKERLQAGDIKLQYQPTADMLADLLTKPVKVAVMRKLRSKLYLL